MGNKSVLMKQRIRLSIVGIIAVMVVATASVMGFSARTFAADTGTANVIKVSPVRTDITIAPGDSKVVPITVTNPTSSSIEISPIENDFISQDEKGTPALILDANQYAPTHSLKRFLSPIDNVTIPAGKSTVVNVTITVPKTAQAGGYFGAIRFAPASTASGGQVNLSANVASIILLTVPGDLIEKLNMTDFEIQQDGKSGGYFSTPNNISAYLRYDNKGNVQSGPFGVISVKKGSKVVYDANFNVDEPRGVILPDGSREWSVPLNNLEKFGHYTVTATLTYGTNNPTTEVIRSFWIIPLSYLIIAGIVAFLLVVAIIVIIFLIRRRHHRRHFRSKSTSGLSTGRGRY